MGALTPPARYNRPPPSPATIRGEPTRGAPRPAASPSPPQMTTPWIVRRGITRRNWCARPPPKCTDHPDPGTVPGTYTRSQTRTTCSRTVREDARHRPTSGPRPGCKLLLPINWPSNHAGRHFNNIIDADGGNLGSTAGHIPDVPREKCHFNPERRRSGRPATGSASGICWDRRTHESALTPATRRPELAILPDRHRGRRATPASAARSLAARAANGRSQPDDAAGDFHYLRPRRTGMATTRAFYGSSFISHYVRRESKGAEPRER